MEMLLVISVFIFYTLLLIHLHRINQAGIAIKILLNDVYHKNKELIEKAKKREITIEQYDEMKHEYPDGELLETMLYSRRYLRCLNKASFLKEYYK